MKFFGRFFYYFRRATENILENPFLNAIAVGIIAVTLFLFSCFLLLSSDLKSLFEVWGKGIQIVAYLKEDVSLQKKKDLLKNIQLRKEVSHIDYVTKEQALERFQKMLKGKGSIIADLKNNNPLPESLEIDLHKEYRQYETIALFSNWLSEYQEIDEVIFGQDWVKRFTTTLNVINTIGVFLGALLILAAVFIISNTIKVTLFARKEELHIMQMVGASQFFIAVPFVIEGSLQGLLGAGIALGLLYGFFTFVMTQLINVFSMPQFPFLSMMTMCAILLGGMILGGVVSTLSVIRFLRS